MRKLNNQFTITLDYQPEKLVNISFSNGEKMCVKSFEIKKKLSRNKLIKLIENTAKELEEVNI